MRDLTAQVTSSLMRFPEVTVDALGEDEITLDSVLHGKFTLRRSGLAWLACGPQLEVVNSVTGARFSAHRFSSVNEHPPSVLVARDFCWLKRRGLLVGLEEAEGSVLCLYDLGISRVVKAVVIPGRITGIEPLVSYGGASASTQHLHQSLRWFFGVVAVVTDVGHVLLVDLCLDDLSCSQSELEASDLEVVNRSPAEIPRIRESVTRQGRHLCLQLSSPTGSSATALQYITRTNQLAVGFSDGYLQLWNMKMLKKEYHSQLEGGRVAVYAFTFQEPENDPRNCCYLWAVQSAQDYEGDVVSLHLLQLAFGERKCLASGKILYEGLEYCEERYSQDLNGTAFPLRAQATSTRLLGCQTIEKFRHHPDRDDSMNEGASPDTSVSIFSWQVKSYGQSKPSTYIGVFDINRWYHAQMPDSLRAGESLHSCPYLAVWSMDPVLEMTSPGSLLDVLVHERSLSRGLPHTSPTPEQFFNPTTYNFDATCLLNSGVVHFTCSGYQKETLSFLKRSASCLSETITDSYSRCLMSGLLSSRLADVQPSNLSKEDQLDAILSTAVESSTLGLITGCLKQWTAEDQPRSAVNLRYILEWAWDKVVVTKEELDGICAPLFDSSSNFTDPQTLQLLQHSQRLLGNLSTIFHCLLSEAQDVTHKGLVSLINKNMVSGLIAQYAQVVLWFCRTGLLPEGADDDMLQISKPFYNYSVIKNYYTGRREDLRRLSRGKWSSDCLMIDGLVAQFGERLGDLWKRDEGGTGRYPPPTLHALLDIYLLENIEESAKHAVVIYLLLDVMYSYPNKSGTSVESFPTAFAIPISLVKLVQGLWLLDHHDHENSLELLLHPSTSRSLWTWQHERVLQALMCQGHHSIALRYLHTMKPHMTSTSQLKLCLTVLLHNRCMVEAWSHLRQHSNKLNAEEMLRFLYEVCQELGLMKELLKLPLGFAEQEVLEKFLQGSGGLQNRELLMVHYLQQANYVPALQLNQALKMNLVNDRDPRLKERSNTRNSILEQYGKVLPRVQRRLATERAKPYHHPSTILREVSRPRPLSTVAKRSATENVLTRATFISNVLSKIGEVWVGKDSSPDSSPLKSPRVPELPVTMPRHPLVDLPEAFIGTPISMSCKRSSRIIDLVIHPSSQKTPEAPCLQQTPPRRAGAGSISSPGSYMNKANELRLLQTPQVVKRARALAASGPMFSSFTPQSILRSSLRPTPVASPSASPGRSASPLPRPKESRITFIEEAPTPELVKGPVHWSSKIAGDGEISLLSRSSPPPEPAVEEEEELHLSYISPSVEDHPPEKEETGRDRRKESESCSLVRESMTMAPMPVAGRISLGLETSQLSIQSVDTTLEFHDAPLPEDLMEEPHDKAKNLEPVAPDVTPLPSGNANERKWPAAEISLGAEGEDQGPAQEVAELEPDLEPAQEVAELEPDLEPAQEVAELAPDLGPAQEVAELAPDLGPAQEVAELAPDLGPAQEVAELAQEVAELAPDLGPAQEVAELAPDLGPAQEVAELAPDVGPAQEVAELAPDVGPAQEVAELAPDVGPAQEVAELAPDVGPAQEVAEPIEHMGLDEFVEQHLFGDDISLTRSSIREASQTWASFSNSGSFCDDGEKVEADIFNPPTSMTQTSVASTSSRATDSQSVVSLDNSGEFSSAVSEEDLEVASEEDSGSEVEIIKEVEGIGRQQVSQNADVFLLETYGSEHLDEQAPAVLSASPECFYVKRSEAEEANVMLNLEAVNQVHEESDGTTDFIEPSAPPPALLEQSELVVRAPVLKECIEPEHPLPETCSNFTLFLEAEEGDSGSVLDGHPLCVESNWDSVVLPGENDLRQEQVLVQELNNSLDGTDQVVHEDLPRPTSLPDITEPVSRTFTGQIAGKNTTEDKAEESEAGEMLSQPGVVSEAVKLPCLSTVHTAEKESSNVAESFGTEEEGQFKETSVMTGEQKLTTDFLPSPLIDEVAPAVFVIKNDFQVVQMQLDSAFEEEPAQIEEAIKLTEANSESESKTMKGHDTQLVENVEEMKEPPSAKRRTTRQRKTVSFPSPIEEAERAETPFPLTPRRSTRSGKHGQNSQVHLTPRKVTSVSDLQPQMVEEVVEPQTPKKTTPRKGTRRTKNAVVGIEEKVAEESSKESALLMTPTRSTRKTKAAHIEVPETGVIDHGQLNDQLAKVPSSPGRVTRKSSRGISLALEVSQLRPQEEAMFERVSVTPKRGARKTRDGKVEKDENGEAGVEELPPPLNSSHRSTRSTLWNHLESSEKEDECPLLETSLAVEPGMQLADALMERLKDTEGGKGENSVGSVHSNVVTKPAGDQIPSLAEAPERPQTDAQVFEAEPAEKPEVRWIKSRTPKRGRSTRASKVPESHTFVFSPPQTRRRTKGRKADYPVQNDDDSAPHFAFSPPTTRARRPASLALSQTVNDKDKHEIGLDVPEVQTEAAKPKAVKPRRKQTAKPKAVALVPSPVKINLISPAASPAEPAPLAQKRREETEAPPQRMNLRRKRLLDSIFPKPVTRRKML